jgi:hypothetical protein
MQLLAASASMSHAGVSGSYADAAQQLNWALLQNSHWLPGTAATAAADAYTRGAAARLAVAPAADTGSWEAAAPDGTVLDAWLAEIQRNSSALIASFDVSTLSTASQLQQLPLATRAVQPQLPALVTVRHDVKGPAVAAWNGLLWSLGVAVGMVVLALLLHALAWGFGGSCQHQRAMRQGFLQPPPMQMPQLLLVAVLLGLPAVVHWSGCLAGTGQTMWMVLAAMLSSCCAAIAVYALLIAHVLGTAEDAMLGPDEPETPATTLAGNAQVYGGPGISSSRVGGFSASGSGVQMDPIQRMAKWPDIGQPVAEGVVQIAAYSAGGIEGHRSAWTPCVTPFQEAANAGVVTVASAAAEEHEVAAAAAASSSCQQQVEDTLLQHQVRLQQQRRQGAYLSMSWKSLGAMELQQQQQELCAEDAAPAAAAAELVTSPQQQQQKQAGSLGEADEGGPGAMELRQQQQQQQAGPLGEADEGGLGSSSSSSAGGGGRQYAYISNASGLRMHPGSSSVTSVNGFFEDVTDVDVEELQRQQIMQVRIVADDLQ